MMFRLLNAAMLLIAASAIALLSAHAYAGQSEGIRNNFAFTMANVSLAREACGYTSNDGLMSRQMRDTGMSVDDLLINPVAMQATQTALAEIAADKVKWCSGVWDAFGDDGH